MTEVSPSQIKPTRTLASILGHEPTPALREVLRNLQECSAAELNWLKLDGVRAVQFSRIEKEPE